MQLIYQNFDGLDVTFQGAMPPTILATLKAAKEEAQRLKNDVCAYLGPRQIPVMVAPAGAGGAYVYRFDTGPAGETWMVADSPYPDRYNIRVSVKSLNFALNGYPKVRDGLMQSLADFCAYGVAPMELGGNSVVLPKPNISRFDYCFDHILRGFQPNPASFVAHSRSTRRVNGQLLKAEEVYRGREIETIRIGSMPSRQCAFYNKKREIIASNKPYWWDVWGLNKKDFVDDAVWRTEVRAGKKELDNWNLHTFEDLERMAGDIVRSILQAIRYTEPTSDRNAARWPLHPIWASCLTAADTVLAPYTTGAKRGKIMNDFRHRLIERHQKNFVGLATSYTSLLGLDISELPTTMERISEEVLEYARQNIPDITHKFQRSEDRYLFSWVYPLLNHPQHVVS
jgi:hypothetical protein